MRDVLLPAPGVMEQSVITEGEISMLFDGEAREVLDDIEIEMDEAMEEDVEGISDAGKEDHNKAHNFVQDGGALSDDDDFGKALEQYNSDKESIEEEMIDNKLVELGFGEILKLADRMALDDDNEEQLFADEHVVTFETRNVAAREEEEEDRDSEDKSTHTLPPLILKKQVKNFKIRELNKYACGDFMREAAEELKRKKFSDQILGSDLVYLVENHP